MTEVNRESLERLVPDAIIADGATGQETLQLHMERYEFACRYLRGRVLDMACGAGYGSAHVLSSSQATVREVVGVDVAPDAIAYARQRYGTEGITYHVANAFDFVDAEGFDSIVSLETIEHVDDPERLIRKFESLLAPDGLLVVSAPTTPSVDVNPHHLFDFTEKSFVDYFTSRGFIEVDRLVQVQAYRPLKILKKEEKRTADLRSGLAAYYWKHPGAFLRRVKATLQFGFSNHYLTVVWKKGEVASSPSVGGQERQAL